MCNKKYYDILSVVVSLVGGIVIAVLAFFSLTAVTFTGPVLSIGLASFGLLAVVLASTSLLRQDNKFNECLCQKAKKLLVSALLLFIVASFSLIFTVIAVIATLIIAFILGTLFIYVLFSLYCFISCISSTSCRQSSCD